jgi:hypothetical protein
MWYFGVRMVPTVDRKIAGLPSAANHTRAVAGCFVAAAVDSTLDRVHRGYRAVHALAVHLTESRGTLADALVAVSFAAAELQRASWRGAAGG